MYAACVPRLYRDYKNKIMSKDEKRHGHKHVDESEKFKRKSLMVRKNRKKMSRILYLLMLLMLALLVAACIFAYFIDN